MACKRLVMVGGGSGFIGSQLGKLLTSRWYNVINIARTPGTYNISWNVLGVCGLPKGVCAVVNCAGQPFMNSKMKWTPEFKLNVKNSRVHTTRILANAINETQVKPMVYVVISGVGVYEPSDVKIYDELSTIKGCDFFTELALEIESAASRVKSPVRLVIIRAGAVLGRKGGMIKSMFLPFYLGLGGRIGSGSQYLPWIHIDDLTRLIVFAIENCQVCGVLNGVAPQVITNYEFTKSFAKALRRPAILPVPEMILNRLFHPERAMVMTKGQYVLPKRVLQYGFQYCYPGIDDACKQLAQCPEVEPEE